jgi:anti-sigma B factor antagonist
VTEAGTNSPDGASWRLQISQRRRGGDLIVEVTGRLAAASTVELIGTLAEALSGGDRQILLDLKGLDYISSAGVLALEAAAARLRMDGRELVVCAPTPPVRLALTLAGFPEDVRIVAEGP